MLYQASLVRHIFNWGLSRRIEAYKETAKGLSYNQQSAEMTTYKQANRWLYEAPANSLQHALKDVEAAFKQFFEKRNGFPKFKAKAKTLPKLRHPNGCELSGKRLKLPKLGWVRCHNTHEHGKIKSVTVKQTPTGEWFATCVTEFVGQVKLKTLHKVAGIDLGLKDFATITDGSSVEHKDPAKFFRTYEVKLAKAHKKLSRCKKGSNNRAKAKLKVAKLHKRITGLRNDWLHQLTNDFANRFDAICLEDLNIKGMMKSKLAKSLSDAALSEFVRQLEYKLDWRGKHCQQIDRWFPSSKLCAECGLVNQVLKRSARTWQCDCGAVHDRDENAARNIRTEGIRLLTSGSDSPTIKLLRKGKTDFKSAPSVDARIPLL